MGTSSATVVRPAPKRRPIPTPLHSCQIVPARDARRGRGLADVLLVPQGDCSPR